MSPTTLFFFNIVMAALGPLQMHMNFKINLSISTNKSAGILVGIMLNLQISLGYIAILTMLSLSICAHKMFSHLFKV